MDKMFATGLLLAVLLALHGLAASSAISADTCCKANFTIAFTSTITMTIPETTVFANGNPTFAAGISTTSAHVATTAFASGSLSSHHSLASAVHSTAANVTGTDAGQGMPASSLGSMTLINTTESCTTGASAIASGGHVTTTLSHMSESIISTSGSTALLPSTYGNAPLPQTNMTHILSTGSSALLSTTSKAVATQSPATAQTSPGTADIHAFPSQPVTSNTTITTQATVTQFNTVTCTIGQPCSFPNVKGSASPAVPSGVNGHPLGSTSLSYDSSQVGAAFFFTSTTMTRTTTMYNDGAAFTPLTSGSVDLSQGSSTAARVVAPSITSGKTVKSALINSTSIANTSTSFSSTSTTSQAALSLASSTSTTTATSLSTTSDTSTMASSSPALVILTTSVILSTSVFNVTISGSSSSPVVLTTSVIVVNATVSRSSPSSSIASTTSMPDNSAARPRPPRMFTILMRHFARITICLMSPIARPRSLCRANVLMHFLGYIHRVTPQSITTAVQTTTIDPLTTITATPTGCASHPDSQECMYNLGFNNAGARASPPFMAALLANLVPAHAKRADTATETITVLRNQENATAATTSMGSAMGNSSNSVVTYPGTTVCFPFCNASSGIDAPAPATTPSATSSGSGSTTAASSGSGSGSVAPSASGAASQGCCGGWGFLLGGGLLVGVMG